ncbi:hypothetical protein [Myxococcus fulvus]|nr:hypothetical protein [Myxococcus fulvus]MCK8496908.1 hypothetical protein [Myxococcus fulvus]
MGKLHPGLLELVLIKLRIRSLSARRLVKRDNGGILTGAQAYYSSR